MRYVQRTLLSTLICLMCPLTFAPTTKLGNIWTSDTKVETPLPVGDNTDNRQTRINHPQIRGF